MKRKSEEVVTCQICKKQKKLSEVLSAELVRDPITDIIRKEYPEWSTSGYICISDLNRLRAELEIRHLHEKIDHLLMNQWQRLLEIQKIQMELIEEVTHKK
jgi:hypothetical protein